MGFFDKTLSEPPPQNIYFKNMQKTFHVAVAAIAACLFFNSKLNGISKEVFEMKNNQTVQSTLDGLQEGLIKKEGELMNMTAEVTTLVEDLKTNEITNLKIEIGALQSIDKNLKGRISSLTEQLGSFEETTKSLEDQIGGLKTDIAGVKKDEIVQIRNAIDLFKKNEVPQLLNEISELKNSGVSKSTVDTPDENVDPTKHVGQPGSDQDNAATTEHVEHPSDDQGEDSLRRKEEAVTSKRKP